MDAELEASLAALSQREVGLLWAALGGLAPQLPPSAQAMLDQGLERGRLDRFLAAAPPPPTLAASRLEAACARFPARLHEPLRGVLRHGRFDDTAARALGPWLLEARALFPSGPRHLRWPCVPERRSLGHFAILPADTLAEVLCELSRVAVQLVLDAPHAPDEPRWTERERASLLLRWPMSPQASAPVLPSLPERGRLARELEHEIARLPVACPDELRFSVPAAALLGIGSGARWDLEMGFLALRLGWSAGHVLQRRSLHRQGLSVAAQGLVASAEATCLAVLRGL